VSNAAPEGFFNSLLKGAARTGEAMKLRILQDSRIGCRRTNQDCTGFAYARHRVLLVVADGMGGHPRGELAARVAAESALAHFAEWTRGGDRDVTHMLRAGFDAAHRTIHERARQERLWDLPRTTCTACVVLDGTATWCHVGDSRLYLVRDGAILATTRDHSGAWLLVEQGVIEPEEARVHPDRNFVYNCLGGEVDPDVEMSQPVALAIGDRILLCSDGLWSPLTNEAIAAALSRDVSQAGLEALLREAERRAGAYADNLSYVMLAVEDDALEDAVDIDALAPGEVVVRCGLASAYAP
jgi:serine/threonine protein phosphatase PrpC